MTDVLSGLGRVTADTRRKADEVVRAAAAAGHPLRQLWGYNPASKPEHSSGRAVDFMCGKAAGDWIADYLWAHRTRLRVKWIIWYQRIRSTSPGKSGRWERMADRGNATQNHLDHVHVFFNDGYSAPASPPAQPAPAPPTPDKPEDPVPFSRETTFAFDHPGLAFQDGWAPIVMDVPLLPSQGHPVRYVAGATIHGQGELAARVAFLDNESGKWLGPSPETRGAKAIQLVKVSDSGNPHASLYVEIWSDTPGPVKVEQTIQWWRI